MHGTIQSARDILRSSNSPRTNGLVKSRSAEHARQQITAPTWHTSCAMESAATDMATLPTNRNSRTRSQPSHVSPGPLPCAPLLGFGLLLSACGRTAAVSTGSSNTSGSPPPAAIAVSISPSTATVPTGGAQVFTATVTGAGNATTNVIWSVDGIANGNAALGTIAGSGASSSSPIGLYTAPATLPSPAVVTVTATSVADASKSASASVTIVCASPGSISPAAISLALGQTQVFTASLCVPAGTAIAWDVNGISQWQLFDRRNNDRQRQQRPLLRASSNPGGESSHHPRHVSACGRQPRNCVGNGNAHERAEHQPSRLPRRRLRPASSSRSRQRSSMPPIPPLRGR